jgi:membrane fusion protein (multidrug efflux system)
MILWYIDYSKYISTDDAKIETDNVSITPKIPGRIAKILRAEEDTVSAGDLLVELDSTDLLAQMNQANAMKNQAISNQAQLVAKYSFDTENTKVVQINYQRTQEDFTRAQNQYNSQVITKEQFDHSTKANEAAKAQLDAANKQLLVSQAQIQSAGAAIATADAQIGIIKAQINNCRIYAPFNGIIAKRWLLPGDVVQPGQSVLTLANNSNFRVVIYIEETKINDIHLNQKAVYTLDAYPGVKFYGKVYLISSNTASSFSLIPASNASGNFTKVTQRIPVKISIDEVSDNKKLSDFNFYAGMSAVVKLIKE